MLAYNPRSDKTSVSLFPSGAIRGEKMGEPYVVSTSLVGFVVDVVRWRLALDPDVTDNGFVGRNCTRGAALYTRRAESETVSDGSIGIALNW